MYRLLTLSLLLPLSALAQPVASPAPEREPLPPAVAVGLPVAATAVAIGTGMFLAGSPGNKAVFLALGVAVAPSVGNLVQGEWGDAATGFGIRAGGTVIVLGALAGTFFNESADQVQTLEVVAAGGALLVLSGAAYDVVTAGMNAHARRVHLAPTGTGLALRVGL